MFCPSPPTPSSGAPFSFETDEFGTSAKPRCSGCAIRTKRCSTTERPPSCPVWSTSTLIWRTRSCGASCTTSPTSPGSLPLPPSPRRWKCPTGTTPPSWAAWMRLRPASPAWPTSPPRALPARRPRSSAFAVWSIARWASWTSAASITPCAPPRTTSCIGPRKWTPTASRSASRPLPSTCATPPCSAGSPSSPRATTCPWPCTLPAAARSTTS